jgi:hypothetical protein
MVEEPAPLRESDSRDRQARTRAPGGAHANARGPGTPGPQLYRVPPGHFVNVGHVWALPQFSHFV